MVLQIASISQTVQSGRQPLVARMLEQCNDIELNPGPNPKNGSPLKKSISSGNFMKNGNKNNSNSDNNGSSGDSRDNMPSNDLPRIKKLGEKNKVKKHLFHSGQLSYLLLFCLECMLVLLRVFMTSN